MRSASDEGLDVGGLKSDDLEDDVDSIRSPFYKPRTPLRYEIYMAIGECFCCAHVHLFTFFPENSML